MHQSRRITSVAILLVALGGPVTASDPPKIEGRWKVVSVELAGIRVHRLEDSELVFADGKKVFTLTGGRIEKGTYNFDLPFKPAK